MKLNKKLTYTAVAMMGLFGLVGCGTDTSKTEELKVVTSIETPVEVEFWHSMSGAFTDTINEIVEDFNNTVGAEKNIHVEAVYQGGYTDAKAKVTASLKAGNSPEIVQGTVNDIMEYISSGYVQPLNDYIFNQEIGIKDFDDIYSVYRQESASYLEGGKYYSLPFAKSTDLLFYNKTLFDEHGIEVPTTWDELQAVSEKITEITGKPALSIDNTANYLITMLMQKGAGYTNRQGELLFNNQESLDAMTLIQENTKAGIWRLAGEDGYSSYPFMAENTFMFIGSSAGEGFLNEDNFDWEATALPQYDLENPKYIQQGNNIAILNQNKTSEEVFGAYEFVKYLSSPEVNTKWAMETGYLPIRESVTKSEEYQEFIKDSTTKPNAVKSAENGFVESIFVTDAGLSSNIVRQQVGLMVDEVVLGDATPQDALDRYFEQLSNY